MLNIRSDYSDNTNNFDLSNLIMDIKNKLGVEIFKTWFKDIEFVNNDKELILISENRISLNWVNNKYYQDIFNIAKNFNLSEVIFTTRKKNNTNFKEENKKIDPIIKNNTFFINDTSNSAACSCIKYFLENRNNSVLHGRILHIHGGNSCGKTTLMNYIKDNLENSDTICLSARDFSNTYSMSVRQKNVNEFRQFIGSKKYLIIDDIDNLSFQKGTILELSKICNSYCDSLKNVIFFSRLSISEMSQDIMTQIEVMNSAISIKIEDPSNELKMKIIKKYIADNKINISMISNINIKMNLKQIKSELVKSKIEKDLDVNLFKKEINHDNNLSSDLEEIINVVCNFYNIKRDEIFKKTHKSNAKIIMIYLIRTKTELTLQKIATLFNFKSHVSVIKLLKIIDLNKDLQIDIIKISNLINI